MSSHQHSSEELDTTVCSSLADLEKTLIQIKSLRYQIYSKYLSEKLRYENQVRKLENEIFASNQSASSTQALSFPTSATPRSALQERSQNLSHISTQTTEENSVQTCNNFSFPKDSKRVFDSFEKHGKVRDRYNRNLYDENLFNVVEQLEFLIKT